MTVEILYRIHWISILQVNLWLVFLSWRSGITEKKKRSTHVIVEYKEVVRFVTRDEKRTCDIIDLDEAVKILNAAMYVT